MCREFKGAVGDRASVGRGEASLVEDFGRAVGASGLDDLLLWPHRLVFLRLALTHMDDHAGGGLCPRVELVFFTWRSQRRERRR